MQEFALFNTFLATLFKVDRCFSSQRCYQARYQPSAIDYLVGI